MRRGEEQEGQQAREKEGAQADGTHVDIPPSICHVERELRELHNEHHLGSSDFYHVQIDSVDSSIDVTASQ